jgi:hypothetical protein
MGERPNKYRRVGNRAILSPTPHMRVLGRSPDGRFGLIVIHDVAPAGEGVEVYYAELARGRRGWDLQRCWIETWQNRSRLALSADMICGVRVPRLTTAPAPGADKSGDGAEARPR